MNDETTGTRHLGPVRTGTILAWVCLAAVATASVSEAQNANIPDENLRAAIEDALGKRDGEAITEAEMETLTVLRAQYVGIENLTGLEHATGLTELYLSYNEIVDLAPLSDLDSLEVLWVGHNRISDVAPLAGVVSLRNLGLLNNAVLDLSPLAGLNELESLDLRGNRVSDLAHLSGLNGLEFLHLADNGIADLSPLAALTALDWLDLSNNEIVDLSPLADLPVLRILYLSGNGIVDISPLAGLGSSLHFLRLASNAISDLSPLTGLTELGSLDLADNRITDVSALNGMDRLWNLDLSDNRISDLAPLADMTRMSFLHLSNNEISALSPLTRMAELEYLRLSDNEISDLSALSGLETLSLLMLSGNQISDVSALSGLTSIAVLHLARNRVADLSALSNMPEMTFLYLSDNAISDLSPLSDLSEVVTLDLSGNAISDLSALAGMSVLELHLSDNGISDLSPLSGKRLLALSLADNQISDITPLSTMLFANTLDLSRNDITDFSHLSRPLVSNLYLSESGIADVSSLSGMVWLMRLDLSNNRIESLSLEEFESLEILDAASNQIVDVEPLTRASHLQSLYLGGNAIADAMALASEPASLHSASLWRNPLDADSVDVHLPAMRERGVRVAGGGLRVPFFPPPGGFRQGFVRAVSSVVGEPEFGIDASDEAWVYAKGHDIAPARLLVGARNAKHFNADDLVSGNAQKGLRSTIGYAAGDSLDVYASADIDVLAYIRTSDGFVTAMHDTVAWLPADHARLDALRGLAVEESGRAAGGHFVPIFNPASNPHQRSMLRLVNPGGGDADVAVYAVDDHGTAAGPVTLSLAADSTRTLNAMELESGTAGLDGALGDGEGKWRLVVSADVEIHVMNLMSSPTDHLTNLSTSFDGGLAVPMFPAAAHPTQQGFVRVANLSGTAGTAQIHGYDDAGTSYGPLALQLPAGHTVHFNSDDWESGNAEKGLEGAAGAGDGAWRLEFESDMDLVVSAYVRTSGGFLTSMHDLVQRNTCAVEAAAGEHIAARSGRRFAFRPCQDERRVPFFNPASNTQQVSSLRLVNRGRSDAAITIFGVDDEGAERGPATLMLPGGTARTLTSYELESGDGDGLNGALGDGIGKWELRVFIAGGAAANVMVMNVLESPTGHLTNLSTWPDNELRLE